MDPQFFLTAVATILIAAMGTWGAVKIAKIIAHSRAAGGPDTAGHLQALDQEVETLRQEMIETQERLDFAERLLAQGAEARRVEPRP
jgi:hypothetical protein